MFQHCGFLDLHLVKVARVVKGILSTPFKDSLWKWSLAEEEYITRCNRFWIPVSVSSHESLRDWLRVHDHWRFLWFPTPKWFWSYAILSDGFTRHMETLWIGAFVQTSRLYWVYLLGCIPEMRPSNTSHGKEKFSRTWIRRSNKIEARLQAFCSLKDLEASLWFVQECITMFARWDYGNNNMQTYFFASHIPYFSNNLSHRYRFWVFNNQFRNDIADTLKNTRHCKWAELSNSGS